jgi:hypothetical protein
MDWSGTAASLTTMSLSSNANFAALSLFAACACGLSGCSTSSNAAAGSAGAANASSAGSAGAASAGAPSAGAMGSAGAPGSSGAPSAGAGGSSSAGSAGFANAGTAGLETPDAGPIVPVVPKAPPFGWVGVIGTGQSLAVGGGGSPQQVPISKAASAKNLKLVDTGADPKYPILPNTGAPKWAAVALKEPFRDNAPGTGPGYADGQYPNDVQGETPHTAMASTLSTLFAARGGMGDYVSVHSLVGWFGRCLKDINKEGGQRAYPASLNEARVWKQLAQAANTTFGVGGIILTHGECDASTVGYGSGLHQFWQDYNTDLKAITGQTQDVVLLATQQSTQNSGASGSAVQLWQASLLNPSQIVCVGPKYQYQYGPDLLHLPATGYVRMGEKYAEIFDIVVNQRLPWKPVQPTKITRAGAVITVAMDVPNPPLVWDAALAPPHQQMNQAWAAGKGFEVSDQSNKPLTIASAAISGSNVVITLSNDPGTQKVHVGYALTQDGGGSLGGKVNGLRGLLRDSDDFTGSDAESLDTDVTKGSAAIKSATAGGFARRTAGDLLSGTGVAPGAVVVSHDSDDQLTLSAPWPGDSARINASYHHGQANYCVHFALDETP